MLLIDLNEQIKGGDEFKPICLNAMNIQSVQKAAKSDDTFIVMMNGKFYFVRESVTEIKKQIGRG